MDNYRISKEALFDLTQIWNYTFDTWSELQADRYVESLFQSFNAISCYPASGISYDEIRPELRGKKCNKHIIFYRLGADKKVEIIRILHQRMDIYKVSINSSTG